MKSNKEVRTVRLRTPFEEGADGMEWAREYPRPQMRRESYLSLCGAWTLSLEKNGALQRLGNINVPFVPESTLSGVNRTLESGERYVYERRFSPEQAFLKDRLLLHFGAVDQIAEVSLNGKLLLVHEGGYLPFSVDVTDAICAGENVLRVRVTDETDPDLCIGKQCKKRGGMWYTPISGIWQSVWLEAVPNGYFTSLRLTPTLHSVTVETKGGGEEKTLTLTTPKGESSFRYRGDRFELEVEDARLWSPEDPYLYEFTLSDGADTVHSYFALRTVSCGEVNGKPRLLLNGKPYFFHGLLDQGYYSDGIYLPATPDGYLFDVREMKKLGFNTLRKHIKIEPEAFYYACDREGMIVFQDMVNTGGYSFLLDTALPTVGMRRGFRHRASARRRASFETDAAETVELLYNHPSVCCYTIFNEGWGQYGGEDRIYDALRAADPTRIYDTASGWFYPKKSDVQSEHIYFKPVKLKQGTLPLVLSEFGGYSCRIEGHVFNLDKNYGYRTLATAEELEDALIALYRDEILPAVRAGLSAAILTQVSDVEDETNGLLTYDRCVCKVTPERMRALAQALSEAVTE